LRRPGHEKLRVNQVATTSVDPRLREAATTISVYGQLPFVPVRSTGCDIITSDGRRILDLYGGHAVAALGYGHPGLVNAIRQQSKDLLFQSNAVALDVRAEAAERLVGAAPLSLERVFFVNSGAEANENALRMACTVTGRNKILAITHGFHGRTAAAGAVTWNSDKWYGFPQKPFEVDFIPRNDCALAMEMIGPDIAAVIFEPVEMVLGQLELGVRGTAEELVGEVIEGGELGASGEVSLSRDNGYLVRLLLQPGNDVSAETLDMLEDAAQMQPNGDYLIKQSGQL